MAAFINVNVENVRARKVYKERRLLEIETAKFYIDFNLKIFCGHQGTS
jgi:hypothetical protein